MIAGEIGRFLMNGSLYRGLRPVMWSPVEKTALAEAEIEYHDHVSPTLWARFRLHKAGAADLVGASVVIWTTTPWTIPGNRAVAYGEEIDYALVHVEGVAEGSALKVGEGCGARRAHDPARAEGRGAGRRAGRASAARDGWRGWRL